MSLSASSVRAALILGLLCGLVSACWHTSGMTEGEAPEGPEPDSTDRSTVTDEDIRRQPGVPVEKVLAGRIAGVTVTQAPDGTLRVRIRGTTSIYGNKEPLYVIDGLPVLPGPNGGLTGIQVSEIESIKVLKDAVSTTMYGARGANGVIVITLKKPGR